MLGYLELRSLQLVSDPHRTHWRKVGNQLALIHLAPERKADPSVVISIGGQ